MNIKNRKIALVIGASSGIGHVTAERLANRGYKVYGTSRRLASRLSVLRKSAPAGLVDAGDWPAA